MYLDTHLKVFITALLAIAETLQQHGESKTRGAELKNSNPRDYTWFDTL